MNSVNKSDVPENKIPISVIEMWLYAIAINNVDNQLAESCVDIISRLGGLEKFYEYILKQKERRESDSDGK